MKLISVKVLGDNFRSLSANKAYHFNYSFKNDRLSTKVFAGLNGSGKSNLLELISEIFYYLDKCELINVDKVEKQGLNFGFEIEYLLPLSLENKIRVFPGSQQTLLQKNEYVQVRIVKPIDNCAEYSVKIFDEDTYFRVDTNTFVLLPRRIIAYTSGQNELVSNPYYKAKFFYFNELEKESNNIFANDRMFFLDSANNFSIFIANYLLASETKLKYLKGIFTVEDIRSFRITLNLIDYNKKPIPLSTELLSLVDRLKCCSTAWKENKIGKEHNIILDYFVDSFTKEAFKFHFLSAFGLFKAFYQLDILNLYQIPSDLRSLIRRSPKWLHVSDEIMEVDPSKKVFRIEKIKVTKSIDAERIIFKDIFYKSLSDGEHQFNEIIGSILMIEEEGCLYLFDEPDTHFNPKWRAKLIKLLNWAAAKVIDQDTIKEVYKQEILITTHSPFVVSDSFKEDVYKFEKIKGISNYSNPKIETYGASLTLLLENIFDRDISISDLSNFDLDKLKEGITDEKDVNHALQSLLNFGESIEKFDTYSYLLNKQKEFKQNDL